MERCLLSDADDVERCLLSDADDVENCLLCSRFSVLGEATGLSEPLGD